MRGVITEVTQSINVKATIPATARARRAQGRFAGLPIAQAAVRLARARHAAQYREIDPAAFVAHPVDVGALLRSDGQPDEIIAAGLLHDVLETTETTSAELHRRFGAGVVRLVESVSDDPSLRDYRSRKRELRDRVARSDPATRAVFAADKIAKVRELALLPAWQLDEPTHRTKLAHYRDSLEMLRRIDGHVPLVHRLDAELNRLVARSEGAGGRWPDFRVDCHRSDGRGLQLGRHQSRGRRRPGSWTRRKVLWVNDVRGADTPIAVT